MKCEGRRRMKERKKERKKKKKDLKIKINNSVMNRSLFILFI